MKQQLLKTPLVLVNLKCYNESIGNGAHRIARAAREVMDESGVTIALAPLYIDIHPINHHYDIPVFAQHHGGWLCLYALLHFLPIWLPCL